MEQIYSAIMIIIMIIPAVLVILILRIILPKIKTLLSDVHTIAEDIRKKKEP